MGSWAIMALNAALVGGSCFMVANIVTQIAGEAIEPESIDPSATSVERPQDQQASATPSVILDRNLFGAQLAGEAQMIETHEEPLTKTKLPLRLLGTAAGTVETRSRAAIEDEKTHKHMIVAVGDSIEGHSSVRVEAIERTRVVLDNAGRPEELLLYEDQPRPRPRNPRNAAADRRSARSRAASTDERVKDRLQKLAGQDGDGISKLLSQARISPAYDEGGEGQILGMKVDAIKQGSVFQHAGLKDGDVITEINGIVIDRQEATPAVLEELLNAETIEIAADRGGASIQLSADAADLIEEP